MFLFREVLEVERTDLFTLSKTSATASPEITRYTNYKQQYMKLYQLINLERSKYKCILAKKPVGFYNNWQVFLDMKAKNFHTLYQLNFPRY